MKHKLLVLISVLMIASMLLAACGGGKEAADTGGGEALRVVHLVNGVLGDKSFFDSADRGLKKATEDFGIQVKTIEAGIDPAKCQPALEDAVANEDYDVLIVGTSQMAEFLQVVAPKYPDKKFIIYDTPVDYATCGDGCKNVYSVTYKQNEGSYLAGCMQV